MYLLVLPDFIPIIVDNKHHSLLFVCGHHYFVDLNRFFFLSGKLELKYLSDFHFCDITSRDAR